MQHFPTPPSSRQLSGKPCGFVNRRRLPLPVLAWDVGAKGLELAFGSNGRLDSLCTGWWAFTFFAQVLRSEPFVALACCLTGEALRGLCSLTAPGCPGAIQSYCACGNGGWPIQSSPCLRAPEVLRGSISLSGRVLIVPGMLSCPRPLHLEGGNRFVRFLPRGCSRARVRSQCEADDVRREGGLGSFG